MAFNAARTGLRYDAQPMHFAPVLFLALAAAPVAPTPSPDVRALMQKNARLAPVELKADVSRLPPSERATLSKLIEAARVMDGLYLRQVWPGNEALLFKLLEDTSPLGRVRLSSFLLHKGPWDRLDHDKPFIPGVPAKPDGAGFYPADAKKADVEAWLQSLSDAERKKASGFFTTIRRGADGKLTAVPYSLEYQAELQYSAQLLREAAALTEQPTLKTFLEQRAQAFLSNDYYASDVAWMKLDSSIEPTIGPYEVYEDDWFNFKAAFQAFITVRDDAETQKLAKFGAELQGIEDHLPIDAKYKNSKLGALAPIRVVNSIFSSGDANRGVQTAAFNLPNDEKVAKQMGTKRTMLKNVQEAKFNRVLVPIAKVALSPADQKKVSFDAFFTHILMHELMHGLGPHEISIHGKPSTVRAELKETYSAIEEAKADISGLFALQHLIDKGVVDKALEPSMYTTFLASTFRSIRFGLNEAHGKGVALQVNWLLDAGGFRVAPDGTFSVDLDKAKAAVRSLTAELMTLQATGNYAQAQKLLASRAVLRPEIQRVLDRLQSVPVDIAPRYVTAEQLLHAHRWDRPLPGAP